MRSEHADSTELGIVQNRIHILTDKENAETSILRTKRSSRSEKAVDEPSEGKTHRGWRSILTLKIVLGDFYSLSLHLIKLFTENLVTVHGKFIIIHRL